MITRHEIVRALRDLGLAAGSIILVHSSLSSLGEVDGGAVAIIDALLETITPGGTLLMPSFQVGGEHDLLRRGCLFDVRTSPSQVGLISETFRRRSGVLRSLSPTHCTAGIGPKARELLDGHQSCIVSVGRGSPYDRLVRAGGWILLLGVSHKANTMLHLIENTNGAPTVCREQFVGHVIDEDRKMWEVPTHPHMPGLQRRYDTVEEDLLAHGLQRNGRVGQATGRFINAQGMSELIGARVRANPLHLCEVFTP